MQVVGGTTAYDPEVLRASGAAFILENVGAALESWK